MQPRWRRTASIRRFAMMDGVSSMLGREGQMLIFLCFAENGLKFSVKISFWYCMKFEEAQTKTLTKAKMDRQSKRVERRIKKQKGAPNEVNNTVVDQAGRGDKTSYGKFAKLLAQNKDNLLNFVAKINKVSGNTSPSCSIREFCHMWDAKQWKIYYHGAFSECTTEHCARRYRNKMFIRYDLHLRQLSDRAKMRAKWQRA